MVNPLSIGPVVFFGLEAGRSPMVVKEQFSFRPCSHLTDFFCQYLTGLV